MALNGELIKAAREGQAESVCALLERGANARANNDEALREACKSYRSDVVEMFLKRGANVHAENDAALTNAAEVGDETTVELLLAWGAKVHADNNRALRTAVAKRNLSVVDLLLKNRANANVIHDGKSVLETAIENHDTKAVALLLDHGAKVPSGALRVARADVVELLLERGESARDLDASVLVTAAEKGRTKFCALLLDRGADVHANNDGALRGAAKNGHTETVALLLDRGANIDAFHGDAVIEASLAGHTETVALLLGRGASIVMLGQRVYNCDAFESIAEEGYTEIMALWLKGFSKYILTGTRALLGAVKSGRIDMVKLLLDHCAKFNPQDGLNLLYAAASRRGNTETVRLLLDRGVKPVLTTSAVDSADLKTVALLLDRGADIHADDDKAFRTAAARYRCSTEMVAFLLDHGADIHAKDDEALREAAKWSTTFSTVKLLLDRGANVNANDDEALRNAVRVENKETVELLLQRGANVQANDNEALRDAVENKNKEIVELLLQRGANVHAKDDEALRTAITLYEEAPQSFESWDARSDDSRESYDSDSYRGKKYKEEIALKKKKELEIIEILRKYGARIPEDEPSWEEAISDPPVRDLWKACETDDEALLKTVLDAMGTSWTVGFTLKGLSAIQVASRFNSLRVATALHGMGADLQNPSPGALHVAVKYNSVDVAKMLCDLGADVHALNDDGQTPIQVAKTHGEKTIMELVLRSYGAL